MGAFQCPKLQNDDQMSIFFILNNFFFQIIWDDTLHGIDVNRNIISLLLNLMNYLTNNNN